MTKRNSFLTMKYKIAVCFYFQRMVWRSWSTSLCIYGINGDLCHRIHLSYVLLHHRYTSGSFRAPVWAFNDDQERRASSG